MAGGPIFPSPPRLCRTVKLDAVVAELEGRRDVALVAQRVSAVV